MDEWIDKRHDFEYVLCLDVSRWGRFQDIDLSAQFSAICKKNGKQVIYINAFHLPEDNSLRPAREAVRVCDGGAQFWGAVFDPASGTFNELQFNGGFGGP